MKKFLLSTMLLAGMSLGFAKGTPVNQTNGTETTIVSEKSSKVETDHSDYKESVNIILKKDKCLDVYYVVVDDPEEEDGFRVDGPYEVEYECDKRIISVHIL